MREDEVLYGTQTEECKRQTFLFPTADIGPALRGLADSHYEKGFVWLVGWVGWLG
jgi:hypothetical protein